MLTSFRLEFWAHTDSIEQEIGKCRHLYYNWRRSDPVTIHGHVTAAIGNWPYSRGLATNHVIRRVSSLWPWCMMHIWKSRCIHRDTDRVSRSNLDSMLFVSLAIGVRILDAFNNWTYISYLSYLNMLLSIHTRRAVAFGKLQHWYLHVLRVQCEPWYMISEVAILRCHRSARFMHTHWIYRQ